jgi:SAM-dependent methyltransferase
MPQGTIMGLAVLGQWRRKLRWLSGRGWTAEDFATRYAAGGADAWGYRVSAQHRARADFILAALPAARFERALEVGCAQGFLSERLAAGAGRLIACDISAEAIAQARTNCADVANVEFHVADIRDGFPGAGFDLCLFSDVLYYLSMREIDAVLNEAAEKTRAGGYVFIVNEWRVGARGLTSPAYPIAKLAGSSAWKQTDQRKTPFGEAELSLAIFRRV